MINMNQKCITTTTTPYNEAHIQMHTICTTHKKNRKNKTNQKKKTKKKQKKQNNQSMIFILFS